MTPDPRHLEIRGRQAIGDGLPPYLIAEIGTNHNRDLATARRLARAAAECGFDCAKFQIYEPDEIVAASVRAADYGLDHLYGDISAQEMFARHLQTPKTWFPALRDLCHELGLDCATTVHGIGGRDWAESIGFDLIKIASMDHTNLPFLAALVNAVGPPILISFGMAELDDIAAAMATLSDHRPGVGMFHCVAVYPPEAEELRLNNIAFLRQRFGVPVGFSDHTEDTLSAVAALALGACCFEKHITLDRRQPGPDHPFALEPPTMGDYTRHLRTAARALRDDGFSPPPERERRNREDHLKSVIARRDLPADHVLTDTDLYLARPGRGIRPGDLHRVIGRRLVRAVPAETLVAWQDLQDTD